MWSAAVARSSNCARRVRSMDRLAGPTITAPEDFFESCTPEVGAHQSNGLGSRFRHVAADRGWGIVNDEHGEPGLREGEGQHASARAEFQDGSLRCPLLQERDHIRVRGSAKRVLCGGMKFVTRLGQPVVWGVKGEPDAWLLSQIVRTSPRSRTSLPGDVLLRGGELVAGASLQGGRRRYLAVRDHALQRLLLPRHGGRLSQGTQLLHQPLSRRAGGHGRPEPARHQRHRRQVHQRRTHRRRGPDHLDTLVHHGQALWHQVLHGRIRTGPRSGWAGPPTVPGPAQNCRAGKGAQGFTTSDTRTIRDAATRQEIRRGTRTVCYKPAPRIACGNSSG